MDSKSKLRAALNGVHLTALTSAARGVKSTPELLRNLNHTLRALPAMAAQTAEEHLDTVFAQGFATGVHDAKGTKATDEPDAGDLHALEWMKTNPLGFLSAVGNVAQSELDWYNKHLPGKSIQEARALVKGRAEAAAYKIDRIVQTSDTKAVTLGRLLAWVDEPYRDFYNYYWLPLHDGREKDVSLLFERRNPMTYWKLRKTFEVDHVTPKLVINRYTGRREAQISAINCRCSVARSPKSRTQLVNDGLISQNEAA
jgi:hypothetical protein